jgi:drug/metabolite transporter (DMT)-like permease
MKYLEKHPMIMIVIGILGISMSAILVRFSSAPSAVTAAWRLCWTVLLQTPVVFGKAQFRRELVSVNRKTALLSVVSGVFLALHFFLWFESLQHTTVASSTIIVCTEVIWVSLGFWLFLKGKLSGKAVAAIAVAFLGSVMIALADSGMGGSHLYGDLLALLAAITVAVYSKTGVSTPKR